MKHTRLGARIALIVEGALQVSSCLWWGVRLLDKCNTGRFLVPYFILIFANVKIKDKSELQQGFNKQEKTKNKKTGWINIVWKPLPSNYCVELLIRHLYSSFIFDAQLLLNLAFLERDGGNKRELLEISTSCLSFSMATVCCWGLGFLGFGSFCLVWFSCPMKFMNQWHALYFNLFCIISLV